MKDVYQAADLTRTAADNFFMHHAHKIHYY